jgi:hypothetical protein
VQRKHVGKKYFFILFIIIIYYFYFLYLIFLALLVLLFLNVVSIYIVVMLCKYSCFILLIFYSQPPVSADLILYNVIICVGVLNK